MNHSSLEYILLVRKQLEEQATCQLDLAGLVFDTDAWYGQDAET